MLNISFLLQHPIYDDKTKKVNDDHEVALTISTTLLITIMDNSELDPYPRKNTKCSKTKDTSQLINENVSNNNNDDNDDSEKEYDDDNNDRKGKKICDFTLQFL